MPPEFELQLLAKREEVYGRLLTGLQSISPKNSDVWEVLMERCCKNYSEKDEFIQHLMEK